MDEIHRSQRRLTPEHRDGGDMGRRRVNPDAMFDCKALHCSLAMRCCAMRQAVSDAQGRATQRVKGDGFTYPSCVSTRCSQGRKIRDAIDPLRVIVARMSGPTQYGNAALSIGVRAQVIARERFRLIGLLDESPTLDSQPWGVPCGDDGPEASEQAPRRVQAPSTTGASVQARPVRQPWRPAEDPPRGARLGPRPLDGGGRTARRVDEAAQGAIGRSWRGDGDHGSGRPEALRRRARTA